jgi:serine phosphatase RsbU (regulator of sigma subunit)/ketosteroid isomerase-like protein
LDGIAIAVSGVCLVAAAGLLARSALRTRRTMRRFQVLNDVADVSERDPTLRGALEAIGGIVVPELADFGVLDLTTGDSVERIAVWVGPGGGEEVRAGLSRRRPSLPEEIEAGGSAPTGPRFFERMTDEDIRSLSHDDADLEFLRGLGVRSALTLPLRARGHVTGALTLAVAWSGRRYRQDDADFARVLSGRVALALDNAGLFKDLERAELARAEIAETLQRGLLPLPLPHIPGWSAAAMYQPAGAQNEVGGDFYDVFPVAGGWMVVIGDVTGRGARAASVTAQARYTLRTAAALTGDPLVALGTLNRALLSRGDSALCSIAAIVLSGDPTQPARLAVAGHPPPLLVGRGEVVEVGTPGPVLGAFADAEWAIEHVVVEPDRQLVVVTDGITEACGRNGRFGEERLRAELAVADHPVQHLEATLRSFVEGEELDDDVAVMAVGPSSVRAHDDGDWELVERLFDAFNRRDLEAISSVCDEEMEFFPVTAEEIGREAPYTGWEGLRDYLADVALHWEELLVTPVEIEQRGDLLLVRGRVFLRGRALGIRDMPAAWIWELKDGHFTRGEVFADPAQGVARFRRGLRLAPASPVQLRSSARAASRSS